MRVQGHARVPLRQPLPEDGRLRPLQIPHEHPGPRRAHGVATAPDPPGRRSQAAPVGAECQVQELPAPCLGPSRLRVQRGQRLGVQQGDQPSGGCGHHDRERPAVGAEPGLAAQPRLAASRARPGTPRAVPRSRARTGAHGSGRRRSQRCARSGLTSSWSTRAAGHLRRRDQLGIAVPAPPAGCSGSRPSRRAGLRPPRAASTRRGHRWRVRGRRLGVRRRRSRPRQPRRPGPRPCPSARLRRLPQPRRREAGRPRRRGPPSTGRSAGPGRERDPRPLAARTVHRAPTPPGRRPPHR